MDVGKSLMNWMDLQECEATEVELKHLGIDIGLYFYYFRSHFLHDTDPPLLRAFFFFRQYKQCTLTSLL